MNEYSFKERPFEERTVEERTVEERLLKEQPIAKPPFEENASSERPYKKKQEPHSQTGEQGEEAVSLSGVWRNRRSIKSYLLPASFFRYFFFEYRKIRYFGNVTHIFLPKVVPPGIQLSRDVGVTFNTYLQPWSVELFEILSTVLSTAWRHLDKKEYNLLVVLKKLCEKIAKTDFSLQDLKDRNLLDKYRSLEMLFLVLHFRHDYPEIIGSALKRVLKKMSDIQEDPHDAALLVRRIVNRDDELPSLHNFLLGLNMLKYRRYLDLRDLIHASCGEVVSEEVFECEGETYREINHCIEECKKELIELQKRRMEIQHLKNHLPLNEKKEIDYKIIEYFYESNDQKKKRSFIEDVKDLVGFSVRLFGTFVSSFENILNGKIHIPGVGSVEIFAGNFFQVDLARLQYLLEKLGRVSYYLESHFTYEQYLSLLQPHKMVHSHEAEAKQLIDEGLAILHAIGNKLERVLRMRTPGKGDREDYIPLEPLVFNGKSFYLPFEDRVIRYKKNLGGKTVVEALSFIVSICYLTCMFFHKPDVYGPLGEEEAVNEAIASKLELLARIAKPESLTSV